MHGSFSSISVSSSKHRKMEDEKVAFTQQKMKAVISMPVDALNKSDLEEKVHYMLSRVLLTRGAVSEFQSELNCSNTMTVISSKSLLDRPRFLFEATLTAKITLGNHLSDPA